MENADNWLSLSAIRGIQAGREYYVAMAHLKVVPKIFLLDDQDLPPELRAQRVLNKGRIPEIASYMTSNSRGYVFSSLTASVDGDVQFDPFSEAGPASNAGRLLIPLDARFLINDGQHRRAAIEAALKECPELGNESISIVFFIDGGLKRSQQMFADLNRHAIRPTTSLSVLYDRRDALSQLAFRLTKEVPVFANLVEMEKTAIPEKSNRLFTLSSLYQATGLLLGKRKGGKISEDEEKLAIAFWSSTSKAIPDWVLASKKELSCGELRRDYVHAHGIALNALASAGACLIAQHPRDWKSKLAKLKQVDWSRTNSKLWEGRALVNGRVSKSHASVTLTANVIKKWSSPLKLSQSS